MSEVPQELRYIDSHEWIRVEGDIAVVGITDHAQAALNDIVYVDLPSTDAELAKGDEFGVVESVKSVSDLYMPVSGVIVAVNDGLADAPETINDDPYGAGWLLKIRLHDRGELDGLLAASEYAALIA